MHTFTITGVLTNTTELSICDAGEHRIDLSGRPAPSDGGFPWTRVRRERLARNITTDAPVNEAPAEDFDPAVEEAAAATQKEPAAGAHVLVPVVPANTLRGQLRRAAAREIYEILAQSGEKLSLDAYNVLQCGAATGNPEGLPPTLDEILLARKNPYLGLFGGGPNMLRSGLRVDGSLAITPDTIQYVGEKYLGYSRHGYLLQTAFRRRNDDVIYLKDPASLELVVADFQEKVLDYQDNILGQKEQKRAERQAAKDAKKAAANGAPAPAAKPIPADKAPRGAESFTAFEHVVRGTNFALRFDIDGGYAHVALFALAMRRWAIAQRLGAFGRLGFGRFQLKDLEIKDLATGKREPFLDFVQAEGECHFGTGEIMTNAFEAWRAACPDIKALDIERFVNPAAYRKPRKAKEKASQAEAA